ncbi:MAG: hypothetical protein JWP30_1894, partial [Homoserinimonas sp.]|nr:hypothetical protein [Homoserinimonas sp.]
PLPAVTPDWLPGAARNTPTAPTPDTLPVSPSSVGTATQLSTVAITDATTGVESVASRVVAPVGGTAASVQPVKASPLAPSASSVPIAPAGGAPSGEESVISAEATTKPTPVTSAARLDGQRSPATGAAAAREDTPVLTRVPTATRAASTVPAATAGTNAHGAHSSPQSKDAGMAVAATAHPAPASAVAEVASAAAATVVPPASAPVAPVTAPPVSAPAPIAAAQSAPFSQQLGQPIFTLAAAGNGDHVMTVTVTPDNLGPVTVRAHVSADGLRVELFAPNDFGREAIRAILPELRRDLAGGGLSAHLDLSSDSRPADPRDGDAGRDRRAPAPTPVLAERQTEEGRQHARMQGTSSTIDVMA